MEQLYMNDTRFLHVRDIIRTLYTDANFYELIDTIVCSHFGEDEFALLLASIEDPDIYVVWSPNEEYSEKKDSLITLDITDSLPPEADERSHRGPQNIENVEGLIDTGLFEEVNVALTIPLYISDIYRAILIVARKSSRGFSDSDIEGSRTIQMLLNLTLKHIVMQNQLEVERATIINIAEDTRKKLARDLHDGPIQNVSAIALQANYVIRLLEREPQNAPSELRGIESLARKTVTEIRQLLFTLRPLVLETQGLRTALYQLAENMQQTHRQAINIQIEDNADKLLNPHQQIMIFHIIEEAINNAHKHAEAALIIVEIRRRGNLVNVDIMDNGVGFNQDAVNANYDQRGSLGLVNMRERAELINASLTIQTSEGAGTQLNLRVPASLPD